LRALGIDFGSKRIGIAISNEEMTVATPISCIHRRSKKREDHQLIMDLAKEWEAEILVVGLPRSLDGDLGPAAKNIIQEVELLQRNIGLPVETFDERFTTVTARQVLRDQGIPEKEQKDLIDQVAASIILQTWLDYKKGSSLSPSEMNNEL
tara:strand:- start:428 stop:880 length:453 start_codon:yes stop_codon:yes gene_type:complete